MTINTGAAISVGADRALVLELLGSALSDARTILDQSRSAAAAIELTTGILTSTDAQLGLPSEAIGQAVIFIEAYLVLESGNQCPADTALASEALSGARADNAAPAEIWTTPLPLIASGRLLTSPGRRRFLASSVFDHADA